ncbi:MAG TPA: AIPR family protein [Candidatus Hydrogenedentes bacterium]|nr:AIPR family protein [Candidatus Hydrogenedentota bacterium]
MPKAKTIAEHGKLLPDQIDYLKQKMHHLAERNPSWGIKPDNYRTLFYYLAVQKVTYLYDDELFEGLRFVDTKKTGKSEELLDAYLVLDQGDEIQVKLFQFKFKDAYDGGISTKELYAFVDRMNRVFLHSDLQDPSALDAFQEVREALDQARGANKRARTRIQCYYIVNGQNVSYSDAKKMQEIRDTFSYDRQTYGFTFETYGGVDIYSLCVFGRIPIQDEVLELNFEMDVRSFLHHNIGPNPNGMPEQVVVGFVNVNQLIRLVDRYSNNELFEKNVRLFLGTGKEVNRRIIETITGNQSAWFGFMNNGVSITTDSLEVDMPASAKKAKVRLKGLQIINGCQTVNALYHAKYAQDLKDQFQGNSNVMVRIYQIEPQNTTFLNALIIATNSQNAIRPEDLLSNDAIQKTLQQIYHEYGIGYERKEGETPPGHACSMTFTKEQAGMAYLAVFMGYCSKLRNSLSRREFFRQGDDYYRAFNLQGPEGDDHPGALPEGFVPNDSSSQRALQILVARCLEEECRSLITKMTDKQKRGSLRKGAYYLARIAYLKNQKKIDDLIYQSSTKERKPDVVSGIIKGIPSIVDVCFNDACEMFKKTMENYLKKEGGNEDAALKNSEFAKQVDAVAKQKEKS